MSESLEQQLVAILSEHCGERGDSEGAVDTLKRIIRERDEAMCPDQMGWKHLCEIATANAQDAYRRIKVMEQDAAALDLVERVGELELRVKELDGRTSGLIRFGSKLT